MLSLSLSIPSLFTPGTGSLFTGSRTVAEPNSDGSIGLVLARSPAEEQPSRGASLRVEHRMLASLLPHPSKQIES